MITFAKKKHISDIASLWNEAFGDKFEDIFGYLKTLVEYCVVFEENNKVISMLFLLPVKCGKKKGRYIYAVATLKSYRGMGISTTLIEFAKGFANDNNEDFLILVPQSEGLFKFYEKRGFVPLSFERKVIIDSDNGEEVNIKLKKLSASEYYENRKKYLCSKCFIEWDIDMLKFAKEMYQGEFLEIIKDDNIMGVAFVVRAADSVIVKEFLTDEPEAIAKDLKHYYNADRICFTYPYNESPSAMMYPRAFENVYFNIALD